LIATDDPIQHRKIVAAARMKLNAVDQATAAAPQGGTAQWKVPSDAPPAPKEDGHTLKKDGQPIAVSKGGQWVQP